MRWHLFVTLKSIFCSDVLLKYSSWLGRFTHQDYPPANIRKSGWTMTLYKWFLGLFVSYNNLINSKSERKQTQKHLVVSWCLLSWLGKLAFMINHNWELVLQQNFLPDLYTILIDHFCVSLLLLNSLAASDTKIYRWAKLNKLKFCWWRSELIYSVIKIECQ